MYLAKVTIDGFRKLGHLEISLRPGLNVFVGPNNTGKTAIIDALRVLLINGVDGGVRLDESDFHVAPDGSRAAEICFRFVFRGLSDVEEADFLPALVPTLDPNQYEVHFSVRYAAPDAGGRLRPRRWCGDQEENVVPSEMLESLTAVYLQPLRDPASGLRPSRHSQIARLAVRLSDSDSKAALVESLKSFDFELEKAAPIAQTQSAISARHREMLGPALIQALRVGLAPADFNRLVSRLTMTVDSFDIEQNGLGYNNLIYMAVVLSDLASDPLPAYRALIVEEPEAHLHPQLQAILLEYLQSKETPNQEENAVQVFVTSHSPNFASLAALDTLGCLHHGETGVRLFCPRTVVFEKNKKEKLQRYLDVTKASLFFANRVVLVEGAAELFLVHSLAERLDLDLRMRSISVLSTEGLNFDAFIPLFGEDRLNVRAAILSDADPGSVYPGLADSLALSATAKVILKSANAYVKPFFAKKTFEYDLALHPENRSPMLLALEQIRPLIAKNLKSAVEEAEEADQARLLYCGMFERSDGKNNIQKGAFAQALAQVIADDAVSFTVPPYIVDALHYITGS